jgi:hypothetical protein
MKSGFVSSHLWCLWLNVVFFYILGSYFFCDNPEALQDSFISDMDLTTSEFVYLYSWPNVLCFVGGYFIDRWAYDVAVRCLNL